MDLSKSDGPPTRLKRQHSKIPKFVRYEGLLEWLSTIAAAVLSAVVMLSFKSFTSSDKAKRINRLELRVCQRVSLEFAKLVNWIANLRYDRKADRWGPALLMSTACSRL